MVVDGGERGTSPRRLTALGVDVSLVRGLDLVLLDEDRRIVGSPMRGVAPDDLGAVAAELRPAVIAIDSPPGPALTGGSRMGEWELMRMGIHCYCTPSDPERLARPFYAWMREGHRAFAVAAAAGYPLYRGGAEVRGRALEVFPHATATLLGADPALAKRVRRRQVLDAAGVDTADLRSMDQIDAALAALTGLLGLAGHAKGLGNPAEGVVVVPVCADGGTRTLTPFGTGT